MILLCQETYLNIHDHAHRSKEKHKKITEFTTKLACPKPDKREHSPVKVSQKRPISPSNSSAVGKKSKQLKTDEAEIKMIDTQETDKPATQVTNITQPAKNAALQNALGPLISEIHSLKESVDTAHSDYADLK